MTKETNNTTSKETNNHTKYRHICAENDANIIGGERLSLCGKPMKIDKFMSAKDVLEAGEICPDCKWKVEANYRI